MNLTIEIEQEENGRNKQNAFPGVLAYGQTREQVVARVQALALRVLANKQRTWGSNAQQ